MSTIELMTKLDELFAHRTKARFSEHPALNEAISALFNDRANVEALTELITQRPEWRFLKWVHDETFIEDIVTKHRDAVLDYYASRPENKSRLWKVLKQLAADDPRFIKAEAQASILDQENRERNAKELQHLLKDRGLTGHFGDGTPNLTST